MNWSEGYFTGVGYTHGYFRQINPAALQLAVLSAGLQTAQNEDFNYLELGFGQGVSINVHAAAGDGNYWGTDFNPDHAASAIALASASGASVRLFDDSFWEFAARTDLPEFDFIVLHGIWSWVSDENRDTIVDLIRRKLRNGGIVYASYNVYPGWAPYVPVRQLMSLFKNNVGALGGSQGTIAGAVKFARDVLDAGADYYKELPIISRHLDSLQAHDRKYIAHEYLNDDWKISTFSETAAHLGRAKVTYAGTTRLLDNIEPFRLTPDSSRLLDQIGDPLLRETAKDFLTNQMFRTDVYVKGARRMSQGEFAQRWSEQRFVLTTHPGEIPQELVFPLGTIRLDELLPRDLIGVLAEQDYAAKRIVDFKDHPAIAATTRDEVIRTMILLVGAGYVSTAQVPTPEIVARCARFNRHVLERALTVREVECLASPVTGGAINVPHICLLFLNAIAEGRGTTRELTTYVWNLFQSFDKKLKRDGIPIESPEESMAMIESMARRFQSSMKPMLRALQVIEP